jgi:uncharacterized protein YjeT (DUF2065 family)
VSDVILPALALVLVIEGILPLASPRMWREVFRTLTELNDGQLRFAGLVAMVAGLLLLYITT